MEVKKFLNNGLLCHYKYWIVTCKENLNIIKTEIEKKERK